MLIRRLQINKKEQHTFWLHLGYSAIEGILHGILLLNEIVMLKSLSGSNSQVALLFQFSVMIYLFSIVFNEWLKRISNTKKLLIISGLVTRLPLLALALFPHSSVIQQNIWFHIVFLSVFLIFYLGNPVALPAVNQLLKQNYRHTNFGRLYGYATSVKQTMTLIAAFLYGLLLDFDLFAFTYVYPLMGILGVVSFWLLTRIRVENLINQSTEPPKTYLTIIKESFVNMTAIFRKNKPYFDFEVGFMFYGFAFMISVSIINIFLVRELDLSFTGIASYKNFSSILAIIMLPYFGKLMGNIDPRKFAIYTYLSLFCYILFIAVCEFYDYSTQFQGIKIYYSLVIAFLAYAVFTATMSLLWYVGSAYFCKTNEAAHYQSIHLTLVGARAVIAPLFGVLFFEWFGFIGVFSLAMFVLLMGKLVLWRSMKKR